jgi:urease accessory protein
MQVRRLVLASVCIAVFPVLASAHALKGVGDFYAGMLHPLTSLEFVLPLIALALFAGQQRREAAIAALGAFPISLMAGATVTAGLGLSLASLPVAEWLGPAVMTLAGLCVALSLRGPAMAVAALFTICGFILGSTQGLEITSAMSAPRFIVGAGCTV